MGQSVPQVVSYRNTNISVRRCNGLSFATGEKCRRFIDPLIHAIVLSGQYNERPKKDLITGLGSSWVLQNRIVEHVIMLRIIGMYLLRFPFRAYLHIVVFYT